jgi:hypothetical protein
MIYAYSNQQERATQIVKFHVSVFSPNKKNSRPLKQLVAFT